MKRQCNCDTGGRRSHRQFRGICLILAILLPGAGATYGSGGWADWTGFGGLNNDWSYDGNWNNATGNPVAPVAGDYVRFGNWSVNSTSVLDQDFSIGWLRYVGGGTHVLDIPAGNSLQITDASVQVGWGGTSNGATVTWTGSGAVEIGVPPAGGKPLNIGSNGGVSGETNTGSLTITGVTVNVHPGGGISTGANYAGGGAGADGTLILGPGAHLNVGTPTASTPSGVTIGYNHGVVGSATGLMDTSGGTASIHVDTLGIGNNRNGDAGALGSAVGTLTMGANNTITSDRTYVAWGDNTTGVVNLNGGLFAANRVNLGSGGTFNFNGGRLAVTDFTTFGGAGTLEQKGGTLAPGYDLDDRARTSLAGVSILRGDYQLEAPGILEIELFGTTPVSEYDQLQVDGSVKLNGGALNLLLHFEPEINDQFTIITSGSGVIGQFAGLSDLGTFDRTYLDSTYRFQISYNPFDTGNVLLRMIDKIGPVIPGDPVVIPAPGAMLLGGIGLSLVSWLRRRRTL